MYDKNDDRVAGMCGKSDDVITVSYSVSALQHWAAFVMTVGPGAAIGFYVAMVGFYIANFESRVFFIAMVFCAYVPGPLVALLQQFLDTYFDEKFSPAVTYLFRVVFLQLVLATVVLVWLLMPQTPVSVLVVGVVLGAFAQTVIISSSQMVAAMDPRDTSYAMIGNLVGGALPVAAFFLFDFGPASSLASFRAVLLIVPFICIASTLILGYLHVHLDLFQKSYNRLGYDLTPRDVAHADEAGLQAPAFERQVTETQPLMSSIETERGEVPTWVWVWCGYVCVSSVLSVSVMALVAFIGKPSLAQWLSLGKLSMDLIGGVVSLVLPRLACFEQGPMHKTLALSMVLRLAFLAVLVKVWSGAICPYKNWWLVWAAWFPFHLLHAIMLPHVGVTVGYYVLVKDRKRVLRMTTACRYVGATIGVIIAACVIVPSLGLGVHWPDMHRVIPTNGAPGDGAW